ncbi:putative Metallo-beta-lactamase superfamily protein [Sphingobacterium sp. PM2-P1-29]|jgi:hydroxyacylglutathione hydrolase|nr:putative Metallo-beta-lactamase superfamily protein [Sphingobacterium sp. PM2-P1-29]
MKHTYRNIAISLILFMFVTFLSFGKSFATMNKSLLSNIHQDSISPLPLNLTQFMALEATGAVILDARSSEEFKAGYIPKSIHIGWKGPFKIWVQKIFMDKHQPIIYVADHSSITLVFEMLTELGYTQVLGYLHDGVNSYKKQYLLNTVDEVDAATYLDLSTKGQIIDVRSEKEFAEGHIDNAMNFPLKDLGNFNINLPKYNNYYVQCLSGYRSMIAISILKAKGIENVINIKGGYQALKKIKEEK